MKYEFHELDKNYAATAKGMFENCELVRGDYTLSMVETDIVKCWAENDETGFYRKALDNKGEVYVLNHHIIGEDYQTIGEMAVYLDDNDEDVPESIEDAFSKIDVINEEMKNLRIKARRLRRNAIQKFCDFKVGDKVIVTDSYDNRAGTNGIITKIDLLEYNREYPFSFEIKKIKKDGTISRLNLYYRFDAVIEKAE